MIPHLSQRLSALATAAMLLTLGGCATDRPVHDNAATVLAVTVQQADLSIFTRLLEEAGMNDALTGKTAVTVFAPTDTAFKALPAPAFDALARDPAALKQLLGYHMLPGRIPSAELPTATLATLQGGKVSVARQGEYVTVDNATIVRPDLQADNGVVHVIDRVLVPPKP